MSSRFFIYHDATAIPPWVTRALEHHGRNANVILPQIERSRRVAPEGQQVWIVQANDEQVEYVLAVTEGILGSYPIFIFTTKPISGLSGGEFNTQMRNLAVELRHQVDVRRVYSVFALKEITTTFCDIWEGLTGIPIEEKYYDALISCCTRKSFSDKSPPFVLNKEDASEGKRPTKEMRIARDSDVAMVADLCKSFSDESPPFVLNEEDAKREAQYLIKNGLVWVYTIQEPEMQGYEVASIVACTRNTKKVAAITKVYTSVDWQRRGCAYHLVRHVCKEMFDKGKESVVLYVGTDNLARRVYERVGFEGLSTDSRQVGVEEHWLEIGFSRERIQLGHW